MLLKLSAPKSSLNKAYRDEPVGRNDIELFKGQLKQLFTKADAAHSEDTLKDFVTEFLRNTYYKTDHIITVNKERKDFSIHAGKATKDPVAVIAEVKKMAAAEMITEVRPNVKAFHELVLYYLRERITFGNNAVKHLLATDVNNWLIIDANEFDKKIYSNTKIKKLYELYISDKKDNPFFYGELKKILEETDVTFDATEFTFDKLQKIINNSDKTDDDKLIPVYKILSPVHLLKLPFANDSNSLDKNFYTELLHIIGLEEIKDGGKKVLRPKHTGSDASLLENTIIKLQDKECLRRVSELSRYGSTPAEQYHAIALELCITWVNRILFLKLLEAQLHSYHRKDNDYLFLNDARIHDYDELSNLFFQVLAERPENRRNKMQEKFARVPYLNSSLFERTQLEQHTIGISELDNSLPLPLLAGTVLKNGTKRSTGSMPTLSYLLHFLNSYAFAGESTGGIQEENKTLINASVLGLIFEKINGYKDGSFFTPGFITMYMCRETLRRAVVQKFNEATGSTHQTFEDLQEHIEYTDKTKRQQANDIINSLTICDPAVGSGHFLVSALNELIAIKHDLKILQYRHSGLRIKEYSIEVLNDELRVRDAETEEPFEYLLNLKGNNKPELQQMQETLFHEKEALIENCLFGVDINANSVKICRLRLWIELLKNAYYTTESNGKELETLPNIDINIKQGNSLISRFAMDADLAPTLAKSRFTIDSYKASVQSYRSAENKEEKREMETLIEKIKNDFKTDVVTYDPINKKLSKLRGELALLQQNDLFSPDAKKKTKANAEWEKLSKKITEAEKEKDETKNNAIYKDAFEWRFEFPEVLDGDGKYLGFDVVIGNPPYVQLQKIEDVAEILAKQNYLTFVKSGDLYQLFYELGIRLMNTNKHLCFITSNKWMRTEYGKSTRTFLGENYNIKLLIDFGMGQMFETATTYTNILLLNKTVKNDTIPICRINDDYNLETSLEDYLKQNSVEIDNPGAGSWVGYKKNEYVLIKKVEAQGIPLTEWNIKINYGIKTGFNEAFIINTETRDMLVNADPKSSEIIIPILRGEDIKAYVPAWAGKWLINVHNGIKTKGILPINVERDYPAVYKWLMKFKTPLENRLDKGNHWTNLRNCAYLEEFSKPKIIYPNMTKYMPFVYDKGSFLINDKAFIMTGDQMEYLTIFFNSTLFRFCYKNNFPELLGESKELRKVFFEKISVRPAFNPDYYTVLLEELIIAIHEKQDIGAIKSKIEDAVFNEYNITQEERLSILNAT